MSRDLVQPGWSIVKPPSFGSQQQIAGNQDGTSMYAGDWGKRAFCPAIVSILQRWRQRNIAEMFSFPVAFRVAMHY
jgi:hypothetical protein